jgi:soluble lytic murein transglycosylase-like protein
MEVQQEERSSSSGLLWLALIACICGFFYYGGASLLSLPLANVAPLVNSSSCNQIAAGYAARAWALEACQDAISEGIPGHYFARQIYQESGFNPDVVSASGDIGIAQFQPATARGLGIDPREPHGALQGAAKLMGGYTRNNGGDYAKALASYNAGSGALASAVQRCGIGWRSCLPGVTQHYINIIMG